MPTLPSVPLWTRITSSALHMNGSNTLADSSGTKTKSSSRNRVVASAQFRPRSTGNPRGTYVSARIFSPNGPICVAYGSSAAHCATVTRGHSELIAQPCESPPEIRIETLGFRELFTKSRRKSLHLGVERFVIIVGEA